MKQVKNRGVTLVEILVVIAIVSIMAGGIGVSISLAGSRNAEKCAKEINNLLETSRMMSMAQKGDFTLTLNMEKREVKVEGSKSGVTDYEQLPGKVAIYLELEALTEESARKKEITVQFDKSTGKVKTLQADGSEIADMAKIVCENSNGKKAAVVLVKATGKHYVDYE